MESLPRVKKVLNEAKSKLPNAAAITDLAYLVDVNASGSDSLVIYVVVKDQAKISSVRKREVEDRLREALGRVLDHNVYFRWRTASGRCLHPHACPAGRPIHGDRMVVSGRATSVP
jgi:hypothetical protein